MEIKEFLFCFTIREGSFICGIGSLVISILRLYLQWFNMEYVHRLSVTQRSDLPLPMTTFRGLSILDISITAVLIFTTVLLLIGLCKSKYSFFIPWMTWVIVEEVVDVCLIISYAAKHIKLSCSVYIGDAVFFIINLYCILCLYSYMKQLKEETKWRRGAVYSLASGTDDSDEECLINNPRIV